MQANATKTLTLAEFVTTAPGNRCDVCRWAVPTPATAYHDDGGRVVCLDCGDDMPGATVVPIDVDKLSRKERKVLLNLAALREELQITPENTYVDDTVTAAWEAGEYAGNDASWFAELGVEF